MVIKRSRSSSRLPTRQGWFWCLSVNGMSVAFLSQVTGMWQLALVWIRLRFLALPHQTIRIYSSSSITNAKNTAGILKMPVNTISLRSLPSSGHRAAANT
jgi:hypothetical protein